MSSDMNQVFQDENDQRRAMDLMDQIRDLNDAWDLNDAFGKRLEEANEMVAEQEADKAKAEMHINHFLFKAERGMSTHEDVEAVKQALRILGVNV